MEVKTDLDYYTFISANPKFTGCVIDYGGDKAWFLNGLKHREDGPAIEWADGNKAWFLNGLQHREDGPAVIDANGSKSWYLNGKRHRTDGPAIEWVNGTKAWWLNGEFTTEEQVTRLHKLEGFINGS